MMMEIWTAVVIMSVISLITGNLAPPVGGIILACLGIVVEG